MFKVFREVLFPIYSPKVIAAESFKPALYILNYVKLVFNYNISKNLGSIDDSTELPKCNYLMQLIFNILSNLFNPSELMRVKFFGFL